jgi:hypothetical protein
MAWSLSKAKKLPAGKNGVRVHGELAQAQVLVKLGCLFFKPLPELMAILIGRYHDHLLAPPLQ